MSSPAATPSASASKVFGASPASFIEPSPASTYDDSTASDAGDCPQTPGCENDDGVLLSSIAKLSINDGKSTVERYSPPFVRKGVQASIEDPFTTTSRGSTQVTPTGPKSKGRAAQSENWRSGSSSGSSVGRSSPSPSRYLVSKRGKDIFLKKYESENDVVEFYEEVSAEAAQSLFPPACCVFVANLLQSESDESLEVAVTQVFREFGSVWVKIRRDGKHMPFAFCQYRFPEHAERAIREGRGRLINGRPCRCEKAKAHRLFFMERKYGAAVTPDEVAHLLRGFGRLDFIRPATPLELAQMNLNEGVMVQFQMYDDGQAALQAYRNHDVFKMQSMANMCSPARSTLVGQSNSEHRQYIETYEVDKRSVFVGNLPAETEEIDLHKAFEHYGQLEKITLHKNESMVDATQKHCFAFIEFKNAFSVPLAIAELNGSEFGSESLKKTIRVAQKDSEGAKQHRKKLPRPAPAASYQSPPQRSVCQQPVTPLTHAPGYGSPYAYPYGTPYYSYAGTGYYPDAQGQYYPSPYGAYSPYYAYTGTSSYASGTPSTTDAAGSSVAQPQYGYYPQFPYWGYSPTAQQPAYFAPAFTPTATGGVQEDRSVTPTPTGHTSTAESSMESQ